MSITTSDYLSVKNPDLKAKKFTMTIEGGYEASVITYGAVITDLIVPDKDGKPTDIMLGCKGLDEYMGNGANHGAVVGRSANRIKDASFVINGERIPKEAELVKRLCEIPDIKSIVLNINRLNNNVILGEECKTVYGADCIYDELCGVKIRLSPLSFYQVNHAQAEKLYRKAAECAQLDGSQTVLDMYCGAGTIGLSMADKAKNVIGVEIVEPAVRDAKINAGLNGIKNAQFYCADASQAAQMLKEQGIKPDVIVLDPPRKGCSQELVKTVSEMQPDRVVYVSCDPATLARDLEILDKLGYKAEKVQPVDMFIASSHIECVTIINKK